MARRIERPTITRTLYLVRPVKRTGFTHEPEVLAFLDEIAAKTLATMGPFARPLR